MASNVYTTRIMADILLVSSRDSEAAAPWVDYIISCFDIISRQRNIPQYKVLSLFVEDLANSSLSCSKVRLQIVVICPVLLDVISRLRLEKLVQPDLVLGMLLGITQGDITQQQRDAMPGIDQWKLMLVKDQDESFVSSLLQESVSILNRPGNCGENERPKFSLFPKKVKEGSNKVLILLSESVSKEEKLTVTLTKQDGTVLELGVKRRNPHTYHFTVPPACMEISQMCSVSLYKNSRSMGVRQVKCESRMRELDQLLRSVDTPLELMCQAFGLADREQLDAFLVSAFQRNLPPHFNLLNTPHQPARGTTSPEELPTLLHFAAAHGLERLSWQLLECPGGDSACEVRNISDLTPADLAERAGHEKLAGQLRGYMQMNEFSNMYSYLKIMSEGGRITGLSVEEYHSPRPLSETYRVPRSQEDNYQVPPSPRPTTPSEVDYQVPPAPRPTTPVMVDYQVPPAPRPTTPGMMDYQVPPTPRPTTPSMVDYQVPPAPRPTTPGMEDYDIPPSPKPFIPTSPLSGGYMDMQSARQTLNKSLDFLSPKMNFDLTPLHVLEESLKDNNKLSKRGRGEETDRRRGYSEAQAELADILNDFKNKVHNVDDVEKLVESWKNRMDVQRDFKEKQEQLNIMRSEHERLQKQIKESLKRASPFDRFITFIKGGKPKDTTKVENKEVETTLKPSESSQNRPPSSLSVSSSASSGRMSTVSVCSTHSLGDSGTHSDPDDRRIPLFKNHSINEIPSVVRRPTAPPSSLSLAEENTTPTIEDRPPCPLPRPNSVDNDDVCYITPETAQEVVQSNTEYHNMFEPNQNDLPEYMNFGLAPPVPPRR